MEQLRLLANVHGYVAVLAAAALVHPALLLRRGQALSRARRWAVGLSTALTSAAFGLGAALYPSFRVDVRADLFAASARAGWLFETKEHLAFAVASLALGAGVCALAAPSDAPQLRRLAARLYAAAALLCAAVVIMGAVVSATRGF